MANEERSGIAVSSTFAGYVGIVFPGQCTPVVRDNRFDEDKCARPSGRASQTPSRRPRNYVNKDR